MVKITKASLTVASAGKPLAPSGTERTTRSTKGRTQMFARTLIVAGGLVLALVGAAAAQTVVTGTVTRIDQPASVIVLQDGRMVRVPGGMVLINGQPTAISDRKSTRLNSSHSQISYAVFCLKKKS